MRAWVLLLLLPAGCASPTLRPVDPLPVPGASAARVIFFRPAESRWTRPIPLFDGDRFLGILEPGARLELLCSPGEHLFHLLGPGDPLVRANLAGGKTYVIQADSRPAWFRLDLVLEGREGAAAMREAEETRSLAASPDLGERFVAEAGERLADYQRRPGAGRLLQSHQGF
jgi:hypothetical protein